MNVPTPVEHFADLSATFARSEMTDGVREAAKLHALDTLGCGIAAWGLGVARYAPDVVAAMGGTEAASVIGGAERVPAAQAAFANAVLCHALDYDDTHAEAICHVSTVVTPTALAVAEETGAHGSDLLTAIALANELFIRLGAAASGAFHERGFHPTSICGVFAAAAAAARLLGLDRDETVSALGIAGSMASGSFEYLDAGTETKPIHAGWAAHGGIMAARLARSGATGPPSILDGRFGLYATYLGRADVDLEPHFADLGERWETLRIAYKLYPACHFSHGCLDAAEEIGGLTDIRPEDVEEVLVRVPPAAVPVVLEPAATKQAPRSEYEAKFSLQYSVAAMLLRGRVDLTTYRPEAIADASVLSVASRVRYEAKPFPTYPGAFPGGVQVSFRDGRIFAREVLHQRGGQGEPAWTDAVLSKFRANARLALEPTQAEELERAILCLDSASNVGPIGRVLRDPGTGIRVRCPPTARGPTTE